MNSTRYANMLSNNPDMVQAVPAMPMDNSAWTGSNSLGNVVDYAPDADNRQMILKLDEWGPPDMWTISLGIDRPTPATNEGKYFEIVALIDFGIGGSTQRIEVDWINGTMLTVPMNAVSITAIYENPSDILQGMRLSAQLARGTRAGSYAPTKTLDFYALSAGVSVGLSKAQTYRLPPFTREIEILWPYAVNNPFTNVISSGGTNSATFQFGDVVDPDLVTSAIQCVSYQISDTAITANAQRFTIPKGSRYISLVEYTTNPGVFYSWPFQINCHLQA